MVEKCIGITVIEWAFYFLIQSRVSQGPHYRLVFDNAASCLLLLFFEEYLRPVVQVEVSALSVNTDVCYGRAQTVILVLLLLSIRCTTLYWSLFLLGSWRLDKKLV